MNPKTKKLLFNIGKALLIGIVLFFIYKAIRQNIDDIKNFDFTQIYLFRLLLSFILIIIGYFTYGVLWIIMIRDAGAKIGIFDGVSIYFTANVFRYIPGKVMQFVSMFYQLAQKGVSKTISGTSTILLQIIFLISGLIVSIFYFPIDIMFEGFELWKYLRFIPFLGLLVIHPVVMNFILRMISKVFKRDIQKISTTTPQILKYLLIGIVIWHLNGIGFFFFVSSFENISFDLFTEMVGFYPTGYLVGYLTFLSPGGIGVREMVFTKLLENYVSSAFIISILSRFWILAMEVIVLIPIFIRKALIKKRVNA